MESLITGILLLMSVILSCFQCCLLFFFPVRTRILRRSLDIVSRYKVSFYYQVDLIQSCLPRPRSVDAFTMMTVV